MKRRARPSRAFLPILLGVALSIACASPEERFAEHIAQAETYLAEGRSADALLELQNALKIDPNDADLNERLAKLLADRGTLPAAAFHYGEAYRLDATRVDAAVRQASLIWPTAPRRAERIIAEAKKRHPDDPRVLRGESGLAIAMRNVEIALAAAQRAVELEPDDPDNWAQLGASWAARTRELKRNDEPADPAAFRSGIDAFQKVDDLTGGHVGARVEIGRLYGHWGDHEQAVASFRGAIALAKERESSGSVLFAAQKLAGYAGRAGSLPLRVEALREIVGAAPKRVEVWDALATGVERLEGPDAAEAVYRELLAQESQLAGGHVAYASFLSRQRRPLDAIAHLDQVISDGLDQPILWEQLMRLELAQRRLADARATLAEMQERHGGEPATRRAEARLAIREGRSVEAVEILRDLTAEDDNAETERLRALAELNEGNLSAAETAVARAVTLSPSTDVSSLRLQAKVLAKSENWKGVIASLEQLEERGHALSSQELLLRARAHYDDGDAEQGVAAIRTAMAEKFAAPAAAVLFFEKEGKARPDEARAHLEKVLRLAPGNFHSLEAMTSLDIREGKVTSALERLDRLVESQLAGPQVLLLRAQLLSGTGQYDRAEADALRAFEASPDLADAVEVLFSIYSAQGKLDEARRSFEEADEVGVLHSGARVLLGRLYLANGERQKAVAMYEKVVEEDPTIISAKNDLAYLLASEERDLDRALSYAEDAQRERPRHPGVADTVGYVYYRKGRHQAALQQFRYAIELTEEAGGSSPTAHYHLGLALAALGRQPEALEAFEKALAIDPEFSESADARSRLESARREPVGAKGSS